MGVAKNIGDTTKTFIALLSLGLVGLLFLIIFGNLQNNLGFGNDSTLIRVDNETGAYLNQTGYQLTTNSSISGWIIINLWNGTGAAELIPAVNYSINGTGSVRNATIEVEPDVNITYTYLYATPSTGKQNTNEVILNLTGGAVTFFGFSNVWFVLLAVTLLIIIVISVIRIVGGSGMGGGSKGGGRSTFPT